MKRHFQNGIEAFEIQEKKRFDYFVTKAESLGIPNAQQVVKELINNPRITQLISRMAGKNCASQNKWFTKKTRSAQIECTERISPMCLGKFLSASQDTVCIRCRSIIKK